MKSGWLWTAWWKNWHNSHSDNSFTVVIETWNRILIEIIYISSLKSRVSHKCRFGSRTSQRGVCWCCCFILIPKSLVPHCLPPCPHDSILPPSYNDQEWRMWRYCRRSWYRCRHWWTAWRVRGRRSLNASKTTMSSCRLITLPQRWEVFTCPVWQMLLWLKLNNTE